MKTILITIFTLFFFGVLIAQKNEVDLTQKTIYINVKDDLALTNLEIDSILNNADAKQCEVLKVFNVGDQLPNKMLEINWVKKVELHGRFDVENGDVVIPRLEIGSEFNNFKQLVDLRIYSVGIKKIKPGFCPPNLFSLIINSDALECFPEQILKCKNLVYINLSRNDLKNISDNIFKLNKLESLILELNSIAKIPNGVCKLTELKSLNLNANRISEIPKGLSNLQELAYLDLFSNPITVIPQEVKSMKTLKRLSVDIDGGW